VRVTQRVVEPTDALPSCYLPRRYPPLPNSAALDQAAPLRGTGLGVSAAAQPRKARAAHAGPRHSPSPDQPGSLVTQPGDARSRLPRPELSSSRPDSHTHCMVDRRAQRAVFAPRMAVMRIPVLLATIALTLTAGCTSSSAAHHARGSSHPASSEASGATSGSTAALAQAGLAVPATYQQACAYEAAICLQGAGNSPLTGPIPAALNRPLHFPALRSGQRCPASPGSPVNTADFGGIALGSGLVRVVIANAGDLRRGVADLGPSSSPPWIALKTLWFSVPAYQGPFIIRAERLGHPGPVAMGEAPTVAPLVVPPGPTVNGTGGWREAPGGLWVKAPGCYAWQVDGLKFSEIIIVHAVIH
jgi:hypothetical protein